MDASFPQHSSSYSYRFTWRIYHLFLLLVFDIKKKGEFPPLKIKISCPFKISSCQTFLSCLRLGTPRTCDFSPHSNRICFRVLKNAQRAMLVPFCLSQSASLFFCLCICPLILFSYLVGIVMSVKALGPDYYPYAEALKERGDIDFAKLASLG